MKFEQNWLLCGNKNNINMSSAELARRMVKVKLFSLPFFVVSVSPSFVVSVFLFYLLLVWLNILFSLTLTFWL